MSTNVFDPAQYPDFDNIRDRTTDRPNFDRVWFGEGAMSQAADINDAFSVEERKRKQIGDLVAADGDRLSGGDIFVNTVAGAVTISAGSLYLRGAPRPVDGAILSGIPMQGDVEIGVRMVVTPVTADDDGIYYGLVPGSESYGEAGAVRTMMAVRWAWDGDGGEGDFYRYALLRDGQIISQSAPPTLTGVQAQIAVYDYDAHGNYIVRGCDVKALGLSGTARIFSIAAGVCNVRGMKVNRETDNRFLVEEEPDLATVDLEPHTFNGTGSAVIKVRRPPIAAIETLIVTKEKTVTLTKGTSGGKDTLPDDGVVSILEVKQSATTYVATTSYVRDGDAVSWAPAGPEPAVGSSYTVKYRYYDQVDPDSFTATQIVVSGGVSGADVFVGYTYKLPRHDRILITPSGAFEYLKGESSPENPHPPHEPSDALSLCVVKNDWMKAPVIDNNGTRSLDYRRLNQLQSRLAQTIDMVLIERLKSDANARAPGPALGIFTDPFWDDSRRDLGESQDAACFDGTLQIAIEPDVRRVRLPSIGILDYTERTIINQSLRTRCEKINPYMNFTPVAPVMHIDPNSDFWTETETVTLSDVTQVFGRGNQTRVRSSITSETVTERRIPFLREISIGFRIEGMGAGESLAGLTFDGINVNPGGVVANSQGVATGNFVIPAQVSAGRKAVIAETGSGARTAVSFRGEGRLETTTLQTTTILERFSTVVVERISRGSGPDNQSDGTGSSTDPQAQSFALTEARYVTSVRLWICKIGSRSRPIDVDIVAMENGLPTQMVVATARLQMQGVVANTWTKITLGTPVYIPANTYVALVVRTDDGDHSIAMAQLGDFDAVSQKWVTAQPYITGDNFDGSNNVSWLVHPDRDLTMQVAAAVFSPTQKTINIGSFAVNGISDVLIRADVILPEAGCTVAFRVKIGSRTYTIASDQTLELDAYFTGTVSVTAVLTGNARVSPLLSRDVAVIFGKMKATGRYVGLSFSMGDPVRLDIIFSGLLPSGSSVAVRADAENDTWVNATLISAVPIEDGFSEYTYRIAAHSAPDGGRVRLDLTGTPASRPAISDLRCFTF